jgi:hypothetical protein
LGEEVTKTEELGGALLPGSARGNRPGLDISPFNWGSRGKGKGARNAMTWIRRDKAWRSRWGEFHECGKDVGR